MNSLKHFWRIAVSLLALVFVHGTSSAQEGLGPFMPNEGGSITTAWANAFGPDAESWIRFSKVGPDTFDINYSSSRGTVAVRRIRVSDRMTARALVLGYNVKMPVIIENTTTLGTSAAVLEELRTTGRASSALIYNASLASMQGGFTLREKGIQLSINVDGHLLNVPVVHATGSFSDGKKKAAGDFYFLDNRNNPMLLQYSIQFTGEKTPRSERFVQVAAGAAERANLEQALAAREAYTTYGIHFEFDKATLSNSSGQLIDEIATALNNNPLWTLKITGHTDSIGKQNYNMKLSEARALSVKSALAKRGVSPNRLTAEGAGPTDPVATNKSIQGRALNRRVVLARTDR
jgi:outer membrane protein OmpA-like peptidoglycan-associated protein